VKVTGVRFALLYAAAVVAAVVLASLLAR